MGVRVGGKPGRGTAVEESDRRPVSDRRRDDLSVDHAPALLRSQHGSRLHPFSGLLIVLLIAAPWHILATLRNPPYFEFTLHSGPGRVSRLSLVLFHQRAVAAFSEPALSARLQHRAAPYFWLFHLLWLFPWSVYFPAVAKLSFKPVDRAGRTRLLALCWIGFVLVFFTFSTTQEYYSMPCYPALALLLGSAMATGDVLDTAWNAGSGCDRCACAAVITLTLFFLTRNLPAPGDISQALSQHPGAYKLSLGHMEDLTLASFAYLSATSSVSCNSLLPGGVGCLETEWAARISGRRTDDDYLLPCGPYGHGGLRSVHVFAAVG